MNQLDARKLVDTFLNTVNIEPLSFYDEIWNVNKAKYDYKEYNANFMDVNKFGLRQVLENIIDFAHYHASGIEENNIETTPYCLRSVLDIWRHIKKYNPDTSIYEVMKCIAENWDYMGLYGHFCSTIGRRVFRISDDDEYDVEINDSEERDEFGLLFSDWMIL